METFEKKENEVEENMSKSVENMESKLRRKLSVKQWKMAGLLTVFLIVFGIIVGVYNAQPQRINRQLSLGYKYLESRKYEEAIIAFTNVIDIDASCIEAYVASMEAFKNVNNVESMKEIYDTALNIMRNLDENKLEKNAEYIKILYLSADDVYKNDLIKTTQILEEGFTITGNSEEIKTELINRYVELAQQYAKDENFQEGLKIYDRLLELGESSKQSLNGLGICISEAVKQLVTEKRFEDAKALVNKYKGYEVHVNFDELMSYIEEQEKIENENIVFMKKIYELMNAKDYDSMYALHNSEELDVFINRMKTECCIYIPEDKLSLTGIGVGIYLNDEIGSYFYLGNYIDGERVGNGILFAGKNGTQRVFEGEWKNDAPNGYGSEVMTGNVKLFYEGELVNGLWNGKVKQMFTIDVITFDLSFEGLNGVPTEDKTQEFFEKANTSYEQQGIDKSEWVFAYDIVEWYEGNHKYIFFYSSSIGEGETIGTIGYGNWIVF